MTIGGPRGPRSGGLRTGMYLPEPQWVVLEQPDPQTVRSLADALQLPELVCALLAARGLTPPEKAKRFLRPDLSQLHDPATLADAEVAAERIAQSIHSCQTILVHGDYDVDGISAAALMTRWLTSLGAQVVPFVPHRLRDGYDFGAAGLRAALDAEADLIVTADCGTAAHQTVEAASAAGIDVVITDHHTVSDSLPEATAVVNPLRPDCTYPNKGLCGTALAYKICELVTTAVGKDSERLVEYLDLVALATVADMVPLCGENRVLVHYGLRRFSHTIMPGISALLDVTGVSGRNITASEIGFVLAPRINSAGRIGETTDALQLLLTEDPSEARSLAEKLDMTNQARKIEDERTLDEALEILERNYDPDHDRGIVLACDGWHPGVIGIVATRLVERTQRPVLMIALDGERGRGSGRSIPGFNLFEALEECSEHLLRFGGHKQAAGMDVAREALPALRQAFNSAASKRFGTDKPHSKLLMDSELSLASVNLQLVNWLNYLGPHGIGNPCPSFLVRGVRFQQAKIVGSNHIKGTLIGDGVAVDAIGFGLAERHSPDTLSHGLHDVALQLERNEFRGRVSVQARLLALRAHRREG
ncbi:MAG TPA: single-stranded-DNA-specific exonuclease RecJ [Gemmatimonadetes bacterium]|nr:single-stranded-DNA-specific exonuclease RecJ [Gemmatimonadota bacterium]